MHKEEFADDIAITSMARLWDVGKSEPIKVGKASPTEGALPAALYFAIKYHRLATASTASASTTGGFEEALVANANCGGDRYACDEHDATHAFLTACFPRCSAVRGIVIGMLLGALPDGHALPPTHRWVTGLNARTKVLTLMDTLAPTSSKKKAAPEGEDL